MPTGTVNFWHSDPGFGSITPDDGGKEAHFRAPGDTFDDSIVGQRVSFDLDPTPSGGEWIDVSNVVKL